MPLYHHMKQYTDILPLYGPTYNPIISKQYELQLLKSLGYNGIVIGIQWDCDWDFYTHWISEL